MQHESDTGKEAGSPASAQAWANEIVHVEPARPATYAEILGIQPTMHSNAGARDAEGTPCTPEEADILGDAMARPEAAGSFLLSDGLFWKGGVIAETVQGAQGVEAQDSGDSDALSALAQVNVLESEVDFSDARVIFTDGVAGRSDEASTMGRAVAVKPKLLVNTQPKQRDRART